jgi:hypothetical protein
MLDDQSRYGLELWVLRPLSDAVARVVTAKSSTLCAGPDLLSQADRLGASPGPCVARFVAKLDGSLAAGDRTPSALQGLSDISTY